MNSSFARDIATKLIHYSGIDCAAQEITASELKTEYPEVRNIKAANSSAWYYARLNVVPEECYFYLPSVDYSVFPGAVEGQAEAIMKGKVEAVILRWTDSEGKLWLSKGARNEDVNAGLEKNYVEVFSAASSLHMRKNIN